jgi:hypothetical protein
MYQGIPDSHDFRGVLKNSDFMALAPTLYRTRQTTQSRAHDNDFQARWLANERISLWFRHLLLLTTSDERSG